MDTSAFYALLDRDDANHRRAKKAWPDISTEDNVLVTTNYILVETIALLQSRIGMEAVRGLQEDLLPLVNLEHVSPETHRSALSALLATGRRTLSLVDCVSFEVMRSLGLKTVFSFDIHFKEQGFTFLP